ncbi:MAG: hypothetical protein Q9163_004093 [Psora crenata]
MANHWTQSACIDDRMGYLECSNYTLPADLYDCANVELEIQPQEPIDTATIPTGSLSTTGSLSGPILPANATAPPGFPVLGIGADGSNAYASSTTPTPSVLSTLSISTDNYHYAPGTPVFVGGSRTVESRVTATRVTQVTSCPPALSSCPPLYSSEETYTTTFLTTYLVCNGCVSTDSRSPALAPPPSALTIPPLSRAMNPPGVLQSTATVVVTQSSVLTSAQITYTATVVTTIYSCAGGCTGGLPASATLNARVENICAASSK